jgi:hypothetical protein
MKNWKWVQAKIYNLIPSFLRRPLNNLRLAPYYFSWLLSDQGQKHTEAVLGPLKGKYQGCRCVIIGNGPSLNKMDLSILRDEYTFGLNRIYLLFDKLGFETTFLVSTNGFVLRQFAEDFLRTNSLKFFNWLHRKPFIADQSTVFLCAKPSLDIDGNILQGYFPGSGTVTNLALELAYYLGFSEVILIGVDHSYNINGQSGLPVTSKGDDQNHFSKEYFGKGTVWQLPNFQAMELGYKKNRELFEMDNRVIVDATVGGKLNIFPKVIFSDYINQSIYNNKSKSDKS